MVERLWDVLASRWWSALLSSLVCFGLAALLVWGVPAQRWSVKVAVGLGIVGLCFAALAVLNLRGGETETGRGEETSAGPEDHEVRA